MLRLKQLRQERGITQKEVADMLNLTRVAYTNIENGKRETSFASLIKLANFFMVTTDYLLGRTDIPYTNDPLGATESENIRKVVHYMLGHNPSDDELFRFKELTKIFFHNTGENN